jgi:MerR family transcriptional regulator, thiopeptide resistance regulator
MERNIQDVARLAGTTSRTLRHYDDVGLLKPTRVGSNGYRYYDQDALARLQRILMLRDLGLGIPAIAEVLHGQRDHAQALANHLHWLRQEQARLDRQITSVEITIEKLRGGGELMAEEMFDGFDHTRYRSEVEQRWGAEAYADGDRWWRSMSADEKAAFQRESAELAADWAAAADGGVDPVGTEGQALAARHVAWLSGIPGTPGADARYVLGLADMYVADARFSANYGGTSGAEFVRDALRAYAEREL